MPRKCQATHWHSCKFLSWIYCLKKKRSDAEGNKKKKSSTFSNEKGINASSFYFGCISMTSGIENKEGQGLHRRWEREREKCKVKGTHNQEDGWRKVTKELAVKTFIEGNTQYGDYNTHFHTLKKYTRCTNDTSKTLTGKMTSRTRPLLLHMWHSSFSAEP